VKNGSEFRILAAGWIPGTGALAGYNGLRAVGVGASGAGEISFTFTGIVAPAAGTNGNYSIHVNPACDLSGGTTLPALSIQFARFAGTSFTVRVFQGGTPLDNSTLQKLFYMVQVCRYA
jgi:hypothetical protein